MQSSQTIQKLAAALVKATTELKTIAKDSTGNIPTKGGGSYSYTYAALPAVTEAVRPVLAKHGIAVVQGTAPEPLMTTEGLVGALDIETTLLHESGEWIRTSAIIPVSQATAQGAGSAITYGRRYGLLAAVGLATDDDDDGAAASQPRASSATGTATGTRGPASQPQAMAWDGSVESAMATPMPMGKTKGTPLGEMDPNDLESAVAWARKTDAKKFADFINRAECVIGVRRDEALAAAGADDGSLPF